MEWPPEFSSGKPSPRRELQLQGPRPTPLKVRKDSHKIKKPPIPPQSSQSQLQLQDHQQHQQNQNQQNQQQQQRQPVIIYTVSPKVIHTNASEFMSLVQRLTGSSASTSTATTTTLASPTGAVSPAARFATIEKTKMPSEGEKTRYYDTTDMMVDELFNDTAGPSVERTGSFPGILSPVPSSLPVVPPNFFSPPSDHNPFNFTHDFSPLFQQGSKNYFDGGLGSFVPSPGSTFLSAPITSPTLTFDLFNQYLDY